MDQGKVSKKLNYLTEIKVNNIIFNDELHFKIKLPLDNLADFRITFYSG